MAEKTTKKAEVKKTVRKTVKKVEKTEKLVAHKPKAEKKSDMIAVVMIRGMLNTNRDIKDTLKMLRLRKVNHCVIIPNTPSYKGMLQKALPWITWGEITEDSLEKLVAKRARMPGNKKLDEKAIKEITGAIMKDGQMNMLPIDPVFRLSPPSRGYRHIRLPYPRGDAGYRGDKINELLKRMI